MIGLSGHFRKIAVIADHNAASAALKLECHQGIARFVVCGFMPKPFRFPPEMGLPVVGDYSRLRDYRRGDIAALAVALGQSVDNQ